MTIFKNHPYLQIFAFLQNLELEIKILNYRMINLRVLYQDQFISQNLTSLTIKIVRNYFKNTPKHLFPSSFMSQDLDYEPDVLQFKQIWNDANKPRPLETNPKNLQTIQTNNKNVMKKTSKQSKKQSQDKQNMQPKKSTKRSVQINRQQKIPGQNKKNQPQKLKEQQVIQISTKPNKFYQSSLQNEKNNTVLSHLYLDNKNTNNDTGGFLSNYDIKKALQQKDYELSLLRVTNSRTEDRVRYLQKQLQKKNEIISQLRDRERKVIEKNCGLQSKEFNFDYGKAEYQNFRSDSRRLLKMLQATAEYQNFAKFALDDDGVRFLHKVNKETKSKLDNPQKKSLKTIHFCTCNKQFIPQSGFWVPQKVYSFGKQYVKQRQGEMTQAELELLLYELNKIWREREKRIINTYAAIKAHQVGKYKRKVQNLEAKKGQTIRPNNKELMDQNHEE